MWKIRELWRSIKWFFMSPAAKYKFKKELYLKFSNEVFTAAQDKNTYVAISEKNKDV